jgi:hypothetical protein
MLSSRRTVNKLAAIAAAILPLLMVGGYLIGRKAQQPLPTSLYEAYTVVVNMPGEQHLHVAQFACLI